MFATLLMTVAAFLPLPEPTKSVAHVDLFDAKNVIVVWSDCSATVAPLDTVRWAPTGPLFGGPRTDIAAPTSDALVTTWVDTRGLTRTVRTDCVSLKQVDCVIQHQKAVELMLAAAPSRAGAGDSK